MGRYPSTTPSTVLGTWLRTDFVVDKQPTKSDLTVAAVSVIVWAESYELFWRYLL